VTEEVSGAIGQTGIVEGAALVFLQGTTAALTVMENESGLMTDIKEALERFAPEQADYRHHARWGDRNGAAHIRSAVIGTDVVLPIKDGAPDLGTWQRVMLIDFDERPRQRAVTVTAWSSGSGRT